jgi:hypothetical protein
LHSLTSDRSTEVIPWRMAEVMWSNTLLLHNRDNVPNSQTNYGFQTLRRVSFSW